VRVNRSGGREGPISASGRNVRQDRRVLLCDPSVSGRWS
jgi:hypothetical protein